MTIAPNTDNYTLGKGILYFNKKNMDTGLYEGERDLGNATAVNFNVELEELAHYSSRGGLRVQDQKVISQVTPTVTFTLDEPNAENVAFMFLASHESVDQTADDNLTMTITSKKNRYFDLGYRDVGVMSIAYDTLTSDFNVGATLTGTPSTATAVILQQLATDATSGVLFIKQITGTFTDADTLADDGTTPGAANCSAAPMLLTTNIDVPDGGGGFYTQGTDYTVDTETGRIFILETTTIPDDTTLTVSYACGTTSYKIIKGFEETEFEGSLRFVADNPAGINKELIVWRVSLVPSGDFALIGDDWSTLGFTGEILKDETGHPESPYLNIIVEE